MEFSFDVKKILPDEITLWDRHLIADWTSRQKQKKSLGLLLSQAREVIDALGVASAKVECF